MALGHGPSTMRPPLDQCNSNKCYTQHKCSFTYLEHVKHPPEDKHFFGCRRCVRSRTQCRIIGERGRVGISPASDASAAAASDATCHRMPPHVKHHLDLMSTLLDLWAAPLHRTLYLSRGLATAADLIFTKGQNYKCYPSGCLERIDYSEKPWPMTCASSCPILFLIHPSLPMMLLCIGTIACMHAFQLFHSRRNPIHVSHETSHNWFSGRLCEFCSKSYQIQKATNTYAFGVSRALTDALP